MLKKQGGFVIVIDTPFLRKCWDIPQASPEYLWLIVIEQRKLIVKKLREAYLNLFVCSAILFRFIILSVRPCKTQKKKKNQPDITDIEKAFVNKGS